MCSHTHPQTNIYISKGYNNVLKCTAKIHGYNENDLLLYTFHFSMELKIL